MTLTSIRIRFIFWYTLILAVTFALFSLVLYYNLSRNLYERMDDVLVSKAEGVAASINTYWEMEKMHALHRGGKTAVISKINNANFIKIANRWVEERSNDPELMNNIVQIYLQNGEIIAYSKTAPIMISLPEKVLTSLRKGSFYFDNQQIEVGDNEYREFRILDIPVIEDKKIAYIVQVASPLTTLETALNRLQLLLFILLPLTVLITSALAGEFLVSVTLKPLKNMIRTARQITTENLSLRLTLPETKDETRQLAETFNDMLDKIIRAFTTQKQFIQDVSHELRTPLTVVKGELEVALKRARAPEEYQQILKSNLEEIDKIHKILESLLALARLDSAEVSLKKEPTDMVRLLKDCVADIGILADQKAIDIIFSGEASAMVEVDPERMRRVFLNLLENAIKYTPEQGRVDLAITGVGAAVEIKLSDNGVGIAPEDLPYIFERFYRADKSRSEDGFGLGLSIARSIILAHKGTITCQSQSGGGTVFTITLPVH
jgi:heavy metal sensor kinase